MADLAHFLCLAMAAAYRDEHLRYLAAGWTATAWGANSKEHSCMILYCRWRT